LFVLAYKYLSNFLVFLDELKSDFISKKLQKFDNICSGSPRKEKLARLRLK